MNVQPLFLFSEGDNVIKYVQNYILKTLKQSQVDECKHNPQMWVSPNFKPEIQDHPLYLTVIILIPTFLVGCASCMVLALGL